MVALVAIEEGVEFGTPKLPCTPIELGILVDE